MSNGFLAGMSRDQSDSESWLDQLHPADGIVSSTSDAILPSEFALHDSSADGHDPRGGTVAQLWPGLLGRGRDPFEAHTLAALINDMLQEQAARNGVDLS
jgi:hypothetical protein